MSIVNLQIKKGIALAYWRQSTQFNKIVGFLGQAYETQMGFAQNYPNQKTEPGTAVTRKHGESKWKCTSPFSDHQLLISNASVFLLRL